MQENWGDYLQKNILHITVQILREAYPLMERP